MLRPRKNTFKGILLMLFCSLCLCLGQLVWKLMPGFDWLYIFAGFAIFSLGSILMIFAYRHGELSVLQPINSISYIYSLFLGHAVFHEAITGYKMIGVIAITLGIILLRLGNAT
jgi:undecaprenyl phosphate-alpha-L-ara4N flippase subunit ArnE